MAEEEEYEEVEEEVEEEEGKNQGPIQMGDPQPKNTNIVGQSKAEDKKSSHSKTNKKVVDDNHSNSHHSKKKTSSRKDNKANAFLIPTPEQVVSTRAYLEETVTSVIQEALLELARQRPKTL